MNETDTDTGFAGDIWSSSDEKVQDVGSGSMADAAKDFTAWQQKTRAIQAATDATGAFNTKMKETAGSIMDTGVNALTELGGAMWAAADAAIMGGQSFGAAMAGMLKSTLLSIAQESTVKALFNLAEAAAQWFNPVAVASHLSAAAMYGGVAVLAGGAGLAMSAAGVGAKSSPASSASSNSSSGGYKPSSGGTRRSDKKQPINISLYLGDPGDPSAALMVQKQLQAQLAA